MPDPAAYPPPVADLLRQLPLAPLGPGKPQLAVRPALDALSDSDLGAACRAGLWLAFDFLEESHAISQDLHTPEGSYWHAVMHRREPDASNSKYWWRQVGHHPVFDQLAEQAARLGWQAWNPAAFVDACEKERGSGSPRETLLREIQRVEWELLFAWCYAREDG